METVLLLYPSVHTDIKASWFVFLAVSPNAAKVGFFTRLIITVIHVTPSPEIRITLWSVILYPATACRTGPRFCPSQSNLIRWKGKIRIHIEAMLWDYFSVTPPWRWEMHTKCLTENPNGTETTSDLDVYGKITLKYILRKQNVRGQACFNWFRAGPNDWFLCTQYSKTSGSTKCWDFPD